MYNHWIRHEHSAVDNIIYNKQYFENGYNKVSVRKRSCLQICHILEDTINILTGRTIKWKQKRFVYRNYRVWPRNSYRSSKIESGMSELVIINSVMYWINQLCEIRYGIMFFFLYINESLFIASIRCQQSSSYHITITYTLRENY